MTGHTDTPFSQPLPGVPKDASYSWTRLDGRGSPARPCHLLRTDEITSTCVCILQKIPYTQGLPSQLVSSLVWNGQFGVQMFFAVSGFSYHIHFDPTVGITLGG